MTTKRRRNLSPARIPCVTYVEVMLCSCGCGIYYCYLMDDDDEPIAKFGYKAEEWPEFLHSVERHIIEGHDEGEHLPGHA